MSNRKLIFKAFRAVNDAASCLRYMEGHSAVLRDYGITNITTNNGEWMRDPNMYCIVALSHDESEIYGGIRIQISTDSNLLPVEKAVGKMDGRIYDLVKRFRDDGGVGELCALWNAKVIAGLGISLLLTRAGISVTNQLSINTLVGICGEYTLKMFQRVGFVVDNTLGFNGLFPYPKDEFTARVLGILNSSTLETADPYDKARIQSLREQPGQTLVEQGTKQEIEIEYHLTMQL